MLITPQCGAASDAGAVRPLNEDSTLAAPPLFFVADGMGGHAAGEVASAIAVQALVQLAARSVIRPEDVAAALEDANRQILAVARDNGALEGMGTTISGLALGEVGGVPHWIVANIGDSRTYSYRGGRLTQVTVDHSEIEELVTAGAITAAEAKVHPLRNVVTRSLGSDPAPTADIWVEPADPDDCFLVCSDGLTNELAESTMAELLGRSDSPQQAADALVAAAVAAGGRDNVSVVVVQLSDSTESPAAVDVTAPRSKNGTEAHV